MKLETPFCLKKKTYGKNKEEKKKEKEQPQVWDSASINMYMNTNCYNQDSDYAEVDDCMNQYSNSTGAHVAKLHHPGSCR